MEEKTKRGRGGTSKGPRHAFTVKLDLERSAKLKEILRTLDIAGTEYLGPLIEAHVDAVDLNRLGSQRPMMELVSTEDRNTSISRPGVQRKPSQEDVLRRAQTLAQKINLLLDVRRDASGRRYTDAAVCAGVKEIGVPLSRTRWSQLKGGKVQIVSDQCLRAIGRVFDVDPGYLLLENAELPAPVKAALPRLRLQRLAEVREFAVKALGPVDSEGLREITNVLDQAIQKESVRRYGAPEGSLRWIGAPRTDCRADIRRRAFSGELRR